MHAPHGTCIVRRRVELVEPLREPHAASVNPVGSALQLPAALVHRHVVTPAQQASSSRGWCRPHASRAPDGARRTTTPVPGTQGTDSARRAADGAPQAVGHGAGAPAEVEELAAPAHHDPAEGAVAQHSLGGHTRDGTEALDLALQRCRGRSTRGQRTGRGTSRRRRRRSDATSGRSPPRARSHSSTNASARRCAAVRDVGGALGRLQFVEHASHGRARLGIEKAADEAPRR